MTKFYKNKYKATSKRLHGYNYASEGAYFITICTANHTCEFGKINKAEIELNIFGKIVKEEWLRSAEIRKEITFDSFCIMPNHFHGIVLIGNPMLKEFGNEIPQTPDYKNKFGPQHKNISIFINQFKGACTRKIRKAGNISFSWQSNFYDHIIRNKKSYSIIEKYIKENPTKWEDDKFYRNQ